MALYTVRYDDISSDASLLYSAVDHGLRRLGYERIMIRIMRAQHEDSTAAVGAYEKFSDKFSVTNDAHQGCVLAPTLFNFYFDVVICMALEEHHQQEYCHQTFYQRGLHNQHYLCQSGGSCCRMRKGITQHLYIYGGWFTRLLADHCASCSS